MLLENVLEKLNKEFEKSRNVAEVLFTNITFQYLHNQIVVHLIYLVVMWINTFPSYQGISETYHLREIATNCEID